MAQKMTVEITDDLDGESPADETIEFAIDGVFYEIDLSSNNADKMRIDLGTWVSHARKVNGRQRGRRPATGPKEDLAPIRNWAIANGMKVSSRGRVSADIIKAFWERDKTKDTTTADKAASKKVAAALNRARAKATADAGVTAEPEFSAQQ